MADDVNEMSFEQAIAALEQVVGQLDRGDVALNESIALYERGALLRARCQAELSRAAEKVAKLTLDADGNAAATAPLDG